MRLQGIGDLAQRDPKAIRWGAAGIREGSAAAGGSGNSVQRSRRSESPRRMVARNVASQADKGKGAPLAKLVALGKEVETLIKSCDAAVQKHSDATANLQAFLVNDWAPFVAKVNGERQLLGGEAKKQLRLDGSEGGVGLFRSLSKSRSKETLTLALVDEHLARAESEVVELKKQRAELEHEAQQLVLEERSKKEAALAEIRKSQAQAEAKAKALEAELSKP
jgi:hypothetical protein